MTMNMAMPMRMVMVVRSGMMVIVHAKTAGTRKMYCYTITTPAATLAQNNQRKIAKTVGDDRYKSDRPQRPNHLKNGG